MGQQHNKVIKRRRLKAYIQRKKDQAKAGISTRGKGSKASSTLKAAAKKVAKKPAVKKAAKPKKEEVAEVIAAEAPAEEAAPAAES